MGKPKFVFDPENHIYTLGDIPLSGVTGIIKRAGLMGTFYGDATAMAVGSAIHEMTRLYDAKDLDESSLDESLIGPLESWKAFRAEFKPKILEKEKPRYNRDYSFAGTPDRLIEVNGRQYVLDIKSGSPMPWHLVQLGAYSLFWNPAPKGVCVYLDAEGKSPRVKFYGDTEMITGRTLFICAARLEIFRVEHKVK